MENNIVNNDGEGYMSEPEIRGRGEINKKSEHGQLSC